jgi:hypothetical protein
MDETVLVLWPGDHRHGGWVGAGHDRSLSGAVRNVVENVMDRYPPGDIHLVDDWWPMEMCPILIPQEHRNIPFKGCRPMLHDNNVVAVLLLLEGRI